MTRYSVLGPLEVLDDRGVPIDLGGRQPRVVIALLIAAAGRPVPIDRVVDALWGDGPPAAATNSVQSYVSRLRRRVAGLDLRWEDGGYRLTLGPDDVDADRFEQLADEGARLLAADDPERAAEALRSAAGLWRGDTLQEMADIEALAGFATRLDERRLGAEEDRFEAELRCGRHAAIIGELRVAVAAQPLRERFREQLALALYRSGRQSEALRAIEDARRELRDQLGLEPARPLRELENRILAHDRSLDLATTSGPPAADAAPGAVDGVEIVAAGDDTGRTSLVGRGRELADLVGMLDSVRTASAIAVVEGEPGIGKTRLADELGAVARSRGALVAWGRADESGAAPALWPWLPLLRAVADAIDDVPSVVSELLAGDVPAGGGQAGAVQFDRFDAIQRMIDEVAARRPVVLLLDDLQWADATSLELVSFLAGRLGPGTLLVATLRQRDVGRNDLLTDTLATVARSPGSRRVGLLGLDGSATAALVAEVGHERLGGDAVDAISDRAEGNPFYAIELARLLSVEQVASDVPPTVGDVIRRRLGRLPDATRELVEIAAIQGRDADLPVLARVAGRSLPDVLDDLDLAVVQRVLVDDPAQPGVLRFSHALIREVVLDDLTALRRARLHLRVADAIESGGVGSDGVEILAEHLWRAVPVGVGLRAADAIDRAAEVALSRVSYATAEDLLERSAQLWRSTGVDDTHAERELLSLYRLLEVGRARRYYQSAASTATIERTKELAERLGRRDLLLDVMWFEWSALATAARLREQQALYERLLTATAGIEGFAQYLRHQVGGVLAWGLGDIPRAIHELDAALALTPDRDTSNWFAAEQRLVGRLFWLFNHLAAGDLELAELFAEYDAYVGAAPDRSVAASVCGFAATAAVTIGAWDEVARFAAVEADVDPYAQFVFWVGQAKMHAGLAMAWHGDIDAAVSEFADGDRLYLSIGARSAVPCFRASLALNAAMRGRPDVTVPYALAAREMLDLTGERWNESMVLLAEAASAVVDDRSVDAAELVRRAASVAEGQGAPVWARRAIDVGDQLGIDHGLG